MVKLTTKYLFRKISYKNQPVQRRKGETDLEYLRRITHLHLQSQFIDKIATVPECQSIAVVYLQNNLLQTIHNLDCFPNLMHLYLQHNHISKMENLNKLKSLRKLYLGYNEISVVEGLEELTNLTELHLESQRLPLGETLYFDPRSLSKLSYSLKVLNIANNNLTTIRSLMFLGSLSKLIVDNNQLEDLDDVTETLSSLPMLEIFSSEGNPVASDRKYLDAVVVASKSLKVLNGKNIDDRTRLFITNLTQNKQQQRRIFEGSTSALDLGSRRTLDSSREIGSKSSPRVGSLLFPVLGYQTKMNPKVLKITSPTSSKGLSQIFENSVRVSHVYNSGSF